MAKKRLLNETMTVEEAAKFNFLKEDYADLQRHVRASRKKDRRRTDKRKRLQAEVRFLQRKYQMFTEKDHDEPANPLVFPESGAKVLSVYRKPKELTEVLAARHELTGLLALMSTNQCPSLEMTGQQPSPMRIMPTLAMPHGSFVTPVAENNGLVNAQKPSRVKDGRNKKTKAHLFVSPEYSAKSITIPRRSKEPTEALAIEDKSARHELNRMPTLAVPHSSFVTPVAENNGLVSAHKPSKIKDGRNKKTKAHLLVSPEYNAKSITIPRRSKEPTEALAIEDKSARHELNRMLTLAVPHGSFVTPAAENIGLVSAQKPSRVKDGRNKKTKTHLLESPEYSAKSITDPRRSKEPTESLAIEDKSARDELNRMPTLAVPHGSFVTPVAENNGLVSAQKPSRVKDGRNKKTKAHLLESPEYSAKSITIPRRSKEPTEALAIEDKSARHELNRMQTKSSTNVCSLPKMPSAMRIMPHFKLPHGSLVRPAVMDKQNKKIKTDPLVSPKFDIKIISTIKRPKEPTKGLATGDEPARGELIGMQPFLSIDDCTAPEMTGLQASAMQTMPGFEVHHSSLITSVVEPASKKRHLENNGLITAQKPSTVKDGRNRKIKADPLVFPESVVRNISISSRPEELTEALATEDEPARYEYSGTQPLLLTNKCNYTLPEMTGLQPSATRIMTAYTVPHRSLVTPIVEPTNKKRPLQNNVIDDRNKKIKCGVENLPFFRRPKEPTEALPIEDRPARHELTGLHLFSSSDACMSPKMTALQPSATVPQRLVVRTMVRRQNNGVVSAHKPLKVKESQRKKTKDNSQKPISLHKSPSPL